MNKNTYKILLSIFFLSFWIQTTIAKNPIVNWEKAYQELIEKKKHDSLDKELFYQADNIFKYFLTYAIIVDETLKEEIIKITNQKLQEIVLISCTSDEKHEQIIYEMQFQKKLKHLSNEEIILFLDAIYDLNQESMLLYKKRMKNIKWLRKKLITQLELNKIKKYSPLEKKVIHFYTNSK